MNIPTIANGEVPIVQSFISDDGRSSSVFIFSYLKKGEKVVRHYSVSAQQGIIYSGYRIVFNHTVQSKLSLNSG